MPPIPHNFLAFYVSSIFFSDKSDAKKYQEILLLFNYKKKHFSRHDIHCKIGLINLLIINEIILFRRKPFFIFF